MTSSIYLDGVHVWFLLCMMELYGQHSELCSHRVRNHNIDLILTPMSADISPDSWNPLTMCTVDRWKFKDVSDSLFKERLSEFFSTISDAVSQLGEPLLIFTSYRFSLSKMFFLHLVLLLVRCQLIKFVTVSSFTSTAFCCSCSNLFEMCCCHKMYVSSKNGFLVSTFDVCIMCHCV